MYSEKEARELVLKAGLKLVETKLIARTWGNISARISPTQFVITPSGRAYDGLSPEDLVIVNIKDGSYEGSIKPSSEKGIHAASYLLRPDVNFIIHTHQFFASAVCAEEKNTEFAPCVKYAPPGTDKLRDNVMICVDKNPEDKAFLLSKHGTMCLGESCEEAFEIANKLEEDCRELFEERKNSCSEEKAKMPWLDDYAQLVGFENIKNIKDDPEAIEMVASKNKAAAEYVRFAKPLGRLDVKKQHENYIRNYSKLIQNC